MYISTPGYGRQKDALDMLLEIKWNGNGMDEDRSTSQYDMPPHHDFGGNIYLFGKVVTSGVKNGKETMLVWWMIPSSYGQRFHQKFNNMQFVPFWKSITSGIRKMERKQFLDWWCSMWGYSI
uniref:Uncharacterized protein n=1 Tax=Megaselia scalaris TaxID=36166 RepID=T1GH58_MEGSC